MTPADPFGLARLIGGSATAPQLRANLGAFWKEHCTQVEYVREAALHAWGEPALRVGATIILGACSAIDSGAYEFVLTTVPDDADWRVQEALAEAITWRCEIIGWQESEDELYRLTGHAHPNVRRACIEGPRVWTKRPYFDTHHDRVMRILERVADDPSDYVLTALANCLSDTSKVNPTLVIETLDDWAVAGRSHPRMFHRSLRILRSSHPAACDLIESSVARRAPHRRNS